MAETTFGKLLRQYMRRIRAGAKDVADELGVSRQTILNWVNGVSMPNHCQKVIVSAEFLRLTIQETNELLEAAGCDKLSRNNVVNFVSDLFDELSKLTPYPSILLLSQTDCNVFFFRNILLQEAEKHYSFGNVLHIHTPFFTSADINTYFAEFGKQCGFKGVNNDFSFERALQDRLKKAESVFLLLTRFEQGLPALRKQLGGILHNLSDLYPRRLHLILCGGEKLAELKYRQGDLALLIHTTIKCWPELSRSEVYTLRDHYFKGVSLNDNVVDELLTISGAQPQLLNECLKLKQQYPNLDLEDYPNALSESECVWQFFMPFAQDISTKQQLCQWLQQEDLGKAQPYILDDLLRQLYWKNLLVERDKRLYWRCDTLRIAGLKILGTHRSNL